MRDEEIQKPVKPTTDLPEQKTKSEHQTKPDLVPFKQEIVRKDQDLPKAKVMKQHNTPVDFVEVPKPKPQPAPVVKQKKPKMSAPKL